MIKLEICCYSVECAINAQQSGADRIELCSSPGEGGLTPSYGMLRMVSESLALPVHPIVRPRGGDFCYSDIDFAVMKNDVAQIREMGFAGVVIGILNEEGQIDLPRMQQIMWLRGHLSVTFHRAFDMCRDAKVALEQLTELGVDRILTSGQQRSAEAGLPLLSELQRLSQRPVIMAGAGVRLGNLHKFVAQGITELHSSAGQQIPSRMQYRQGGVTMSSDQQADEFSRHVVDSAMVAEMKQQLKRYD